MVLLMVWLSAMLVTGVGGDRGQVLAPACVAVVIGSIFYSALLARSPHFPLDEIGTLYAGAVLLYSVIPLVSFAILGAEWLPTRDSRILWLQPGPAEVARIGWYYVLYLASFATVYLLVRRRSAMPRLPLKVQPSMLASTVVLYAVFVGGLLMVNLLFDLGSAKTYSATYVAQWRLPLAVRQFIHIAQGLRVILELVLMVWVFSDFPRRRWLLVAWLAIVAADTVLSGGERTPLVLMMVAALVLYHHMVRPVRVWTAVGGSVAVVLLFTALGTYRMFRELEHPPTNAGPTLNAGEFEVLFVNALDMQRRVQVDEVGEVPPQLYAADAIAFVPSQLLPFEKMDLSEWYLQQFYPATKRAGGGLAFGVVPQSLLGLGWLDLLLRGAFLGAVYGLLHRAVVKRAHRVWYLVAYVWIMLTSYQTVRASTLAQLSPVVQHLVPLVLVVEGMRFGLRRTAVRQTPALGAAPA